MRSGLVLLGAGVASLSLLLGFMVAASGTPVAGVAIPAAFGLAVSAFGWIQPRHGAGAAGGTASGSESTGEPSLRGTARASGALLLCFSAGFAAGLYLGASARLSAWFAPVPKPLVPSWTAHELPPPPSAEAAVYWLYLQTTLQAKGLADEQVRQIYELQAKDWDKRVRAASNTGSPPSAEKGAATGTYDRLIEEWLRQAVPGNPIANQPPSSASRGQPS